MASYITITDAETDPEAPLTSELAKKWRDNPIAIAEDDPTAPKIKRKNIVSGASAATQTFTGLADYSGIDFFIAGSNSSGSAADITLAYSTNGGTAWSANFALMSVSASGGVSWGWGAFDFASGSLISAGANSSGGLRASNTATGASLNINAVRFTFPNSGVALIRPNGGTV